MSKKNRKEVEKKSNVKNTIIQILGIVGILMLIIFVIVHLSNKNNLNHIKEISYSKYQEVIKDDDYTIVLLASPTCSHCFSYKPLMNQVLYEYNLEAKYVDVSVLDKEEIIELHDSISALISQFNNEGNYVIPTPTTIIFKNGKEIDSRSGNLGYDGFLSFLKMNGVV